MKENIGNIEDIEQKQFAIMDWIKNISEEQRVAEIDRETLRVVLESYGANFESLSDEEKESLRGYSEKNKAIGMRAVWGEKYGKYKEWVNQNFIPNYEIKSGIELPKLVKQKDSTSSKAPSERKDSGMIQFFGEITNLAIDDQFDETYKSYTEARIKNGIAWSEGRKEDRIKIKVPTAEKPILIGSFPKEFPVAAMKWLAEN